MIYGSVALLTRMEDSLLLDRFWKTEEIIYDFKAQLQNRSKK